MKLNVMKSKPQITDHEIQGYMDFDKLIEKHNSSSSFFSKGKIISIAAMVAIIATAVYFSTNDSKSTASNTNKIESKNQTPNSASTSNSGPKLLTNDSLTKEKPIQKIQQSTTKQANTVSPVVNQASKTEATPFQKDVFVEAEPIDGFPKLYNFFNQNLKYPESSLKDKIEGVEIVSFVIDENGNVSTPKITQSLGKSFDEEALRLLNAMPKWKSATLNGRPVPSKLSMPFTFSINK